MKKFITKLTLIGLVLVAMEATLEVAGFGHPALVTTDSPANYELLPNQEIRRTWPLSESLISHVRTNRFGMRSAEILEPKAPETLRIYFLGDSFTYGTTQVDQNDIFTDLIAKELPAKVHQRVEVMNGSAGGWAIANELAYLREHGTVCADRLILVLNDGDPSQQMAAKPTGPSIPSTSDHPRFAIQELWARGVEPKLWHAKAQHDPGTSVDLNPAVIEQNLHLLDDIRETASKSASKLSILFIPARKTLDDPATLAQAKVGRDAVARWADNNATPFVDIGPAMARTRVQDVVLRDGTHYNRNGHRAIATAIEQNWGNLTR